MKQMSGSQKRQLLLRCWQLEQCVYPLGGNRAVGDHGSGLEVERGDDHFVWSGTDDNAVLARRKVCEGELTQFICRNQSALPGVAQERDAKRMGGSVPHWEYLASNNEVLIGQDRLDG